jgi:hypothetical protein
MGPTYSLSDSVHFFEPNRECPYHQGSKIEGEIQCLIFPAVMEENDVLFPRNRCQHASFRYFQEQNVPGAPGQCEQNFPGTLETLLRGRTYPR